MSSRTSSQCRLYFISFGIFEPIQVTYKVEFHLSRCWWGMGGGGGGWGGDGENGWRKNLANHTAVYEEK